MATVEEWRDQSSKQAEDAPRLESYHVLHNMLRIFHKSIDAAASDVNALVVAAGQGRLT